MKLILLFSILSFAVVGQEMNQLQGIENSLSLTLDSLRSASSDSLKIELNKRLKNQVKECLADKAAFSYPFQKLKSIGFVDSPDKLVRIVNWNIELSDQTQKYVCFILKNSPKNNQIEVTELIDTEQNSVFRPEGIIEASNWYGALYYKIIPIQKGTKTVYTLLGWDGNNSISNIKIIESLFFTGKTPKLGSPIFKTSEGTLKRMIFEHTKKSTMTLRYEAENKRIIFDHLSPEVPSLKGYYSFYAPDLSYDAFILDGNKWVLKEDVIGLNKATDSKSTIYVMNQKSGKVEKKSIKAKWINPSNEAPQKVTIDNGSNSTKNVPNSPELKTNDKRNPNDMKATLGKRKRRNKH
jgi:hypothetical protein